MALRAMRSINLPSKQQLPCEEGQKKKWLTCNLGKAAPSSSVTPPPYPWPPTDEYRDSLHVTVVVIAPLLLPPRPPAAAGADAAERVPVGVLDSFALFIDDADADDDGSCAWVMSGLNFKVFGGCKA